VPAATVRGLETLWQQLEDSRVEPPTPPPLGYRGCTLVCGSRGRWFAYGGLVSRDDVARLDPRRQFERILLKCAPKGLIPPVVLAEVD
jgi:hypothetical protein